MVGTNVSFVVFLFWEAVFGLLAAVWKIFFWAKVFVIFTFYWAKAVAKLDVIIKSFVDTDIVLHAASSSLFYATFDLVLSTFNCANSFTAITVGIFVVTYRKIILNNNL